MNTPTPRTDESDDKIADLSPNAECNYALMKAHARKLERELTAVTEQRDKARSEAIKMSEKYNTAWRDRFQSFRVRDKFSWENNQPTEL